MLDPGNLYRVIKRLLADGLIAEADPEASDAGGVRLALGASPGDVVRMVLAQGLRLTAGGALLGLVASTFATRLVQGYLLNVSALDAVAFTGGVAVLLGVAVLAALAPARRAGSADPLVELRTE